MSASQPKSPSPDRRAKLLLLVTAVLLAACGLSDDERQLGSVTAGIHPPPAGSSVRVSSDENCVEGLDADYCELINSAAADGAILELKLLQSSSAASLQSIGSKWDFQGDQGSPNARADHSRKLADEAQLALIQVLEQPRVADGDYGADLAGLLSRLLGEASRLEPERGPRTIRIVTAGGVHRTEDLDLLEAVDTEDWEPTVEMLGQSAARLVEDTDGDEVKVLIEGIGNFDYRDEGVPPGVIRSAWDFWQAVCIRIEEEGIVCSAS